MNNEQTGLMNSDVVLETSSFYLTLNTYITELRVDLLFKV